MAKELSDTDVFGGAQAPSVLSDAEVFGGGKELSDDEVFGGKASWVDTAKSLPGRVWMGGMKAASDIERLHAESGSEVTPDQEETYQRFPESPAAKEYFARQEAVRVGKTRGTAIEEDVKAARPAGEESWAQGIVGGAAESLLPSAAGLATYAATRSPAAAMAVGLGGNLESETAGKWTEAVDAGATPEQAGRSAGFQGVVSTILEATPLGVLTKAGGTVGKKVVKFGGAEAAQEGLTQVAGDVESNISGWTDYSAGEVGSRALDAAVTGAVMAGMMAPGVKLAEMRMKAKQVEAQEAQTGEMTALMREAQEQAGDLSGTVTPGYSPQQFDPLPSPLTPREQAEAEVQRRTIEGGLALPESKDAEETSAELARLHQERQQSGIFLPDEGGMSAEVMRNREQRALEGDDRPHDLRQYVAGSDDSIVGMTPRQVLPSAGQVAAISGLSEKNAPAEYIQGMTDAAKKLLDKYAPGEAILLNFDQFDPQGGAFGLYQTMHVGDRVVHVITPREYASYQYDKGSGKTAVDTAYGFAHEFGHLLENSLIFQSLKNSGLSGQASTTLRKEIASGNVTEELLQGLEAVAPVEGRLVRDWWNMRQSILDGTMTAQEFMEQWVGTRKLGSSVQKQSKNQDTMEWARQMLGTSRTLADGTVLPAMSLEGASALDLVQRAYPDPQSNLSFAEFSAEQFARAAYKAQDFQGTGIGEFFKTALARLKQLFVDLKREGMVAPRETYQEWLDQQTLRAKSQRKSRKQRLPKALSAEREAEIAKELAAIEGVQQERAPVAEHFVEETPPAEVVALSDSERKEHLRALVNEMWEYGTGGKNPMSEAMAKSLLGKIERGELEVVRERLEKYMETQIFWDRETQPGEQEEHNIPEVTSESLAGLAPEEFRNPKLIAQAAAAYAEKGTESPFFKRWDGGKVLRGEDGEPLVFWRGDGAPITFFDQTLRGSLTGAPDAKQAFWVSDNKQNAEWYALQNTRSTQDFPKPEQARKAQSLRIKLEAARNTKNVAAEKKIRKALADLMLEKQNVQRSGYYVQSYFVRLENPMEVSAGGQPYDRAMYSAWVAEAIANGHDGLIVRDAPDPFPGTQVAFFSPMAAKFTKNTGTFDKTDELHWDKENQTQMDVKRGLQGMVKIGTEYASLAKLRAANTIARGMDGLIQLQQRAASDVWDGPLQYFAKLMGLAEVTKNQLQYGGEEVTKALTALGKKQREGFQKTLEQEWKSQGHSTSLVGLDEQNNVVWTPAERMNRHQVARFEHQDSLAIREMLSKNGIDIATPEGEGILRLYLNYKNSILIQYAGLEHALIEAARVKFQNAPQVYRQERLKIEKTMEKLRTTPFVPQGRFGKYVLTLQKKIYDPERKQNVWTAVRVQHFEDQAKWQKARSEADAATRGSTDTRAVSKVLDDYDGHRLQLPSDFLENAASTGFFEQEQLDALAQMLIPVTYEKIEARYERLMSQMDGAETDMIRNYADFIWHNANYIWKQQYRREMLQAHSWKRQQIRETERRTDISPEEKRQLIDRMRRNQAIMTRVQDYVLHPPQEYQGIRLVATMIYLAYNIKTAILNFSTMAHTAFAAGSEYGEGRGMAAFTRALKDTAMQWQMQARIDAATKAGNQKELRRLNILKWVFGQAMQDGIIDQSYSYFLAGNSNGLEMLRQFRRTGLGKGVHTAMDWGMLPFRAVEKANRIASLYTFVDLELERLQKDKVPFEAAIRQAYATAVQKTNLLQNAYDQANKAEILRGSQGKKSLRPLFTMFMSYVQFMGWMTTGGYERSVRAQIKHENAERSLQGKPERALPNPVHGVTVKLWLMYLFLGGLWGLPFAQNIRDLVQFAWRTLFGQKENIELEVRKFIVEMGGNPEYVTRGLSHNVGGFDVSGSLGLGRVVPGTDMLTRHFKDIPEALGKGGLAAAGAAGGLLEDLIKVAGSIWEGKRASATFSQLPGVLGSIGKAWDAEMLQSQKPGYGVVTKKGESLVQEHGVRRDLMMHELAGQALGFTPTIVSSNRQREYAESSEVLYWKTKRADLLQARNDAFSRRDEQELKDVTAAIEKYNATTPDPRLRLTGRDLALSLRANRAGLRKMETFGTTDRRYRGIVSGVDSGFEQ